MLAYAALPVALHFVVPEMLAARGIPASVGWGYIDLWSLELVLSRLRVGPPEGPGIAFDEFRANLARDSLAEGRIELENLRLRGASFDADSLGAAPFSGPNLPFPQIEFQDLRLARLSEKLGRDVVVRHARLNRESPPAQKGLALELEVDAGGAPLELSGTLREDGETRSFEGSLSASGVSARLLDPSPADGPSTWSGTAYAVADFEIRHRRPDSRTSLRAEGDLITTGLAMHAGGLAVTEADSVWKGLLTLSGPAFGVPQRVYFQGTLDVSAARVEDASGASGASVSGFHWDGIGGWHGVPVAAGEGSAESVEYFGRVAGDETMHVDLERVQLRATLDDSGRFRLERLRARNLRAGPEIGEAEIRAQSLEGREIQVGSDGLRVERVAAANLVALGGEGSEARRWSAERPVLQGVAIDLDARAQAAGAVLESLAVRGPTFRVKALGARMEALRLDPGDRFEVGLASLEALEHRSDEGRETRIRDLRGESVAVDREGALEARALHAARIAASHEENGSWTGYDLATKRLRLHSGNTEAGEAALDTLVYRTAEGERLEAAGLLADSLDLQSDAGAAERLEADSLRFEATRGASWEARALSLSGPKWRAGAGAGASVARSVAARLRYRSPEGERWRFAELDLGAATRDPEGAFRVAHAGSGKASVTLPSGEALEAVGVRTGVFERNAEGAVSVADLGAETLAANALSGVEWQALPVEAESLLLPGEGRVDLRRVRSGSLSLHDGAGGRWQGKGIAARSFDWHRVERRLRIDPLELERLAFTSARGVDWHADALFVEGLDWPRGRTPRVGNAAAARLEGKAAPGLAFRLDELQATGDESGDAAPSRLRVLSAGAGHLESTTNESRFSWSAFRATDLHLGGAENLGANRVVVEEASLSGTSPSDAGVTASRMEIADLVKDRGRMAAGAVTVEDSIATLGVDESGEWALPAWPRATRPGEGLAVEIGVLASGGHNRAVLVDRSVDPPLQVEMEPYRIRVSGIDTLDPRESARLEIGGTIDAGARLEVEGEFRAGRRGLDARARLRLRDFDFTRLSEYARRHLDVLVRTGTGDFDAELELSGGEMSAEGEMVVRALSLEAVEADASATGDTLAEAVRGLDEPGRGVALRISLHGPVSDPGFDLPAATARAIATSAGLDPGAQDPVPSSASAQE